MPWCPKCNSEYVRGFDECSDCGCALVEDKIKEPEENVNEPTLLMTAINEYEARGVKSFLESEGIPVLFVHKGLGGQLSVIMGTSNDEVDIQIPKSCIHRARALLEINNESVEWPDEDENDMDSEDDMYVEDNQSDSTSSYEDETQWDDGRQGFGQDSESGVVLRIAIFIGLVAFLLYLISRIF